jgi:hypothetical protein
MVKSKSKMTEGELLVCTVKDIDPEIKPLIVDLNNAGFKTAYSCAGHAMRPTPSYRGIGYITLVNKQLTAEENTKLRGILADHGLQTLGLRPININYEGERKDFININFLPIGKVGGAHGKKREPGQWDIIGGKWVRVSR